MNKYTCIWTYKLPLYVSYIISMVRLSECIYSPVLRGASPSNVRFWSGCRKWQNKLNLSYNIRALIWSNRLKRGYYWSRRTSHTENRGKCYTNEFKNITTTYPSQSLENALLRQTRYSNTHASIRGISIYGHHQNHKLHCYPSSASDTLN